MNTISANNKIRKAFLCLGLVFLLVFLTLPLLAKGISRISGDPIQPEKLDIRPVPVPEPPLVNDEPPAALATPSAASAGAPVFVAVPVPTPPDSSVQLVSAPVSSARPGSAAGLPVQTINWQSALAVVLLFFVLLILAGLHRSLTIHTLQKECVS